MVGYALNITQELSKMTQETQQQDKPTQLPAPDLMATVDDIDPTDPDSLIHYAPMIASLTAGRRQILAALVINVCREDKHTETQIADDLGISRQTIMRARKDPRFGQALSYMMRAVIAGKSDIVVGNLFNIAQKDTKANEILLRIAEIYQPTQRNLNVNASVSTELNTPQSPQQAIDSMTERFIRLGYDKPRLLREIGASYDRLTNQ
jgi:hypothetical protein